MSDMEFNQAKPPEEENFEEAASQAFESAEAGLESVVEPVVEAAEQVGEESADFVGEVIDTAEEAGEAASEVIEEAGAAAGEVVEEAAEEIGSAWQPEEAVAPVEFESVRSEPAAEIFEPEIPPPSPAWQPEPVETPEPPRVPEPPKGPPAPQVPPPVFPPPPARATAEALSDDEERTWALLAHLSVLLNLVTGFLGPVAAIIIYFAFKDRSRFVRYHAMQSFLFQLLAWIGGGILATVLWVISIPLMVVIVGFCLVPFALLATLLPLAALIYGVIGGIKVSQGEDFRYWMVGDWVRGELTGD